MCQWGHRNCGAASVGVLQDNLFLSTGLIMWIGHRKEIRKLAFRALALRRSEPFLADTCILRTISLLPETIYTEIHIIRVLWFRHYTGAILYKVVYRERLRPRFNCYHLDKKGTPFVYLLQQKYTSKLFYGGSQPYQQIYFKIFAKSCVLSCVLKLDK